MREINVLHVLYGVNDGKGYQALTDTDIIIYNMGARCDTRFYIDDRSDECATATMDFVRDCASHSGFNVGRNFPSLFPYLKHLIKKFEDTQPARKCEFCGVVVTGDTIYCDSSDCLTAYDLSVERPSQYDQKATGVK